MPSFHTVLAATDFSAGAQRAADRAALIAHASQARLELLHALEAGSPAREEVARLRLEELATSLGTPRGLSPGIHLRRGALRPALAELADALDASLLVLGAPETAVPQQAPHAKPLLRQVRRPLLRVHLAATAAYQRVLVALDFAKGCEATLQFARLIAPTARLNLFHTFDTPVASLLHYAENEESPLDLARREAHAEATARVMSSAHAAGLQTGEFEVLIAHGHPAEHLLAMAADIDAELIVLGKHDHTLGAELLLGSISRRVLEDARCDVLIVH